MLKIFATQISGLFKKIEEKEASSVEDGSRLLAQAPASNGSIYILGIKEMKAVELEALQGAEPLQSAKSLSEYTLDELSPADRVVVFARHARDEEALSVAAKLRGHNIPFLGISSREATGPQTPESKEDGRPSLSEMADVSIDLHLTKGLVPDDFGHRVGLPYSMAALFVYYGLKFTVEEILAEYEL